MKGYLFIITLLVFGGCQESFLPKAALNAYLKDVEHGVRRDSKNGSFEMSLMYRPSDLVAEPELLMVDSKEEQDSIRTYYKQFTYYMLEMSMNNQEVETQYAGSPTKYNKVVRYLQSEIGTNVAMKINDREIDLLDFIYVQTFGSTRSSKVLLVFPNELNDGQQVNINIDTNMIGFGEHRFSFKTNDLLNTPQLKL